jgi:hypothetical protein
MFDLIDGRKGLGLSWWTLAGLAFFVFSLGAAVGILIERRSADFLAWAAIVFSGIVVWVLQCHPLLSQIEMPVKRNHGR